MLQKNSSQNIYDLIRLGGNFDGGYLVENSIQNSKSLITLG